MANYAEASYVKETSEIRISIWNNPNDDLIGEYTNFTSNLKICRAKVLCWELKEAIRLAGETKDS